jgi:hypothetical protein
MGASTDLQTARVCELVRAAGQKVDYPSFPAMGHSMHGQGPELFARTLTAWAATLPNPV